MDRYEEICKQLRKEVIESRKKEYASEINNGFEFYGNIYDDELNSFEEKYKKNDWDITVKDVAFNIVGQRLMRYKAVLIRLKQLKS